MHFYVCSIIHFEMTNPHLDLIQMIREQFVRHVSCFNLYISPLTNRSSEPMDFIGKTKTYSWMTDVAIMAASGQGI